MLCYRRLLFLPLCSTCNVQRPRQAKTIRLNQPVSLYMMHTGIQKHPHKHAVAHCKPHGQSINQPTKSTLWGASGWRGTPPAHLLGSPRGADHREKRRVNNINNNNNKKVAVPIQQDDDRFANSPCRLVRPVKSSLWLGTEGQVRNGVPVGPYCSGIGGTYSTPFMHPPKINQHGTVVQQQQQQQRRAAQDRNHGTKGGKGDTRAPGPAVGTVTNTTGRVSVVFACPCLPALPRLSRPHVSTNEERAAACCVCYACC